jgi:hypothetical protein
MTQCLVLIFILAVSFDIKGLDTDSLEYNGRRR